MILKNLRASREDLDLKQKDIADFFDLHFTTISGWETGKDTIPILEDLVNNTDPGRPLHDYAQKALNDINEIISLW